MNFKDRAEKKLVGFADVFSDIVNVILFSGNNPLHILDLSQITREQVEMFKSDFKVIADFFYYEGQEKKFEENEHEIIHVKEVMRVLKALTKDEKFDEAYAERIQKKGGSFTMTKFVTEAVNRKERETLLKSVLAIMETLSFNFEQATETLKLNENEKNMILDDLKERGIVL